MKYARVNDARIAAVGAITGIGGTVPTGSGTDDEWTTTPVEMTLDELSDVDTTGVVDGDVLIYDAGTSTWVAGDIGPAVETAGHWEVLMDGGSPPLPLESGSGTDWLYVWVPA